MLSAALVGLSDIVRRGSFLSCFVQGVRMEKMKKKMKISGSLLLLLIFLLGGDCVAGWWSLMSLLIFLLCGGCVAGWWIDEGDSSLDEFLVSE